MRNKFHKLASLVYPTICDNAHSMDIEKVMSGMPMKLAPEQCCSTPSCNWRMIMWFALSNFQGNVTQSTLHDNLIFIALCITNTLAHEISWPDEVDQRCLSASNPHFPSCVRIIDGILVKLCKPWNNVNYANWFNGQDKYVLYEH